MVRGSPRKAKDFVAQIALALAVILVWCHKLRIGAGQKFSAPIEYWGDALTTAGAIRATSEFSYLPIVPKTIYRLGAPFIARWDDYPVTEDLFFFFWGMVARVTGLFAAINLAWVSAAVLAAGSFFFVARYLRARTCIAFPLALVFGLSRCLFYRNVHHITLTYYWPIPLFLLLGIKIASRRGLEFKTSWFRYALVLAAIAGTGNPYYLNFTLQIIVVATVLGKLGNDKSWRQMLPSAALVGVAIGCFFLMNLDSFLARLTLGPNPHAFARSIGHMEQYALRPVDLLVPRGAHNLFTQLPKGIAEYDQSVNRSESAYLGIVGAVGLVWMILDGAYRAASKKPDRTTFMTVLATVFVAYASVAGVNMLLGMEGFVIFRSTNRVSIFLLAMGLLFLATRLSTLSSRLRGKLTILVWALMVPLGLFGVSEAHPPIEHDRHARQKRDAESDAAIMGQLEARLPPMAGVFLVPYTPAPEGDPWVFRLVSHSRWLRFSYGNTDGRPEAEWVKRVAAMEPEEMLSTLERTGFSAVCVTPAGHRQVVKRLGDLGRNEVIATPNGQLACVILNPTGPLTPPSLK